MLKATWPRKSVLTIESVALIVPISAAELLVPLSVAERSRKLTVRSLVSTTPSSRIGMAMILGAMSPLFQVSVLVIPR